MRPIPDFNGQRTCRKCMKTMPLGEFSQIPRRFVCKLCRSRMSKKKAPGTGRKTVLQKLMTCVQWDSRSVFRVPHNLRVTQITSLPCCVGDTNNARIVPIDYRTGMAPYNAVLVDRLTAKCLHCCFMEDNRDMYTNILSLKFPDAKKPIEIVAMV